MCFVLVEVQAEAGWSTTLGLSYTNPLFPAPAPTKDLPYFRLMRRGPLGGVDNLFRAGGR